MKPRSDVSANKLRGGFYTPDSLVAVCLERIEELSPLGSRLRLLEPSVGDGAFVRGLVNSRLRSRIASVTAIEPMAIEAEKARRTLGASRLRGQVLTKSALRWCADTTDTFDVAVGNPPFVRYQFISHGDRAASGSLAKRLGLRLAGVSNLWIPVLLGALSRLEEKGAFAFVVPTECLSGCSAEVMRRWLRSECSELRLDLFPPGSFPEVLQEVAVLSGRRGRVRRAARTRLRLVERVATGPRMDWSHWISGDGPWTKFLLSPEQVGALEAAAEDRRVVRLGSLVAFEVSTVTGANDFFTVGTETAAHYDLTPWLRPLLPRIRHAQGLVYTEADRTATEASDASAWILDFAAEATDPRARSGAAGYLQAGEDEGLHRRYKCRIREPWFRVPGIKAGALLLSKRSHLHPRVVLNTAGVYTTDTIYRGRMLHHDLPPSAIAANFHNSMTLLSAELEGRSFGGGVLELVPSETARLLIHDQPPADGLLSTLDAVARTGGSDRLIAATDASLVSRRLIDRDVMAGLAQARRQLLARRLDRNRSAHALALDERAAA
jgi:adenine-specific DNA-methyltransferase